MTCRTSDFGVRMECTPAGKIPAKPMPIRKQDDFFTTLIVRSRASSSRSHICKTFCSSQTVGDSNKMSSA